MVASQFIVLFSDRLVHFCDRLVQRFAFSFAWCRLWGIYVVWGELVKSEHVEGGWSFWGSRSKSRCFFSAPGTCWRRMEKTYWSVLLKRGWSSWRRFFCLAPQARENKNHNRLVFARGCASNSYIYFGTCAYVFKCVSSCYRYCVHALIGCPGKSTVSLGWKRVCKRNETMTLFFSKGMKRVFAKIAFILGVSLPHESMPFLLKPHS